MNWIARRKLRSAQCRLAAAEAELAAAKDVASRAARFIPGALLALLIELPGEIARLNTRIAQLKGDAP